MRLDGNAYLAWASTWKVVLRDERSESSILSPSVWLLCDGINFKLGLFSFQIASKIERLDA